VALARTLQISARIALVCAKAGTEWQPVVEAEDFASTPSLVASGAGWSVVDPLSASAVAHLRLVARDREPSILAQCSSMLADKLGPCNV